MGGTCSVFPKIMQIVSRRTVYSQAEILEMTQEPVKVMLFRLVRHFDRLVTFTILKELKSSERADSVAHTYCRCLFFQAH